jgi:N-acetyl-anhydromuramyl-L-alanine amidase AmpD
MPKRKKTTLIVVHVTATPPSLDIGAAEVDRMHKAQGWSGIGYGGIIRRDGRLEMGRGWDMIGAHVAGYNSISVGLAMVGGVDANGKPEHNATLAQMATLEHTLRVLQDKYPDAGICGHRDLSPDGDGDGIIEPHEHIKACPCFDVIPWAANRGLRTADIRGIWSAADPIHQPPLPRPDDRNLYLQRLLQRAGYSFGAIDGIIGPKTTKALKQFQFWSDIPRTGEFDPVTVARLRGMFEKGK